MSLVDRLYEWLLHGPTPDCDHIFAAALRHAGSGWAERIVRSLLERGHKASWAALIGRYVRLDPAVRQQLHASPERMQAGIAAAVRSPDAETRANAIAALGEQPYARMAYVLPNGLRDRVPEVRILAGHALREMADTFLGQPVPPDGDLSRTAEGERQHLVRAFEEALRTFDVHKRVEVLEASLWLARDLGERLWERLGWRRSRAGIVVSKQLNQWNHPRLAHFLVSALGRPAWRQAAGKVLQGWRTVEEFSALLRESDLLDDSAIRQYLSTIQSPDWFTVVDPDLTELDADLRPLAARWVCHAGYRDTEKTALLSAWVHNPDPRIHRAAVYALAEVDSEGARNLLKQAADSDSPLASFARWCVLALDTDVVRAATNRRIDDHREPLGQPNKGPAQQADADTDFTMLWRACRRTPPQARRELIATLRENADVWRYRLRSYLHSPDPRDRILVLQVISTERLALQFRHALEPLLSDPVEGIRQLAETLLRNPSLYATPRSAAPPPPPRRPDPTPGQLDHDPARRELRILLEQLSTGASSPGDAKAIGRVRELLRQVYIVQGEASAAQTTSEADQ